MEETGFLMTWLILYIVCENSEGSGETAWMCRLAWASAGRIYDKYHFHMSWLKWAATWQNQQNECAPSKGSDQPGHQHKIRSLITSLFISLSVWSVYYSLCLAYFVTFCCKMLICFRLQIILVSHLLFDLRSVQNYRNNLDRLWNLFKNLFQD